MRKTPGLLLGALLALGAAGSASAKTIGWHGTVVVDLGALDSGVLHGSGVATVNDDSVSGHLDTLRIAGGVTGTAVVPITDPNSTPVVKSIRISGTLGAGTLTGISGVPPLGQNVIPLPGFTRVCLFVPFTCQANVSLNHTDHLPGSTQVGVGIGGTVVAKPAYGAIRISIDAAPWTLGTVTGVNQTVKGNYITLAKAGFVHGAASGTSSTAAESGVIQLISPANVSTIGFPGNSLAISLFTTLTLHFIPEPGLLLLLGAGVVGLGLLGRSRMKK